MELPKYCFSCFVAIQLLWLNVVTDGIQDFALSFEVSEKNIMNIPPRDPKEALFDKDLIMEILYSSVSISLIVFIVWTYLLKILNFDVMVARGYIMTLMVFIQNMHVFNTRSEKSSCFDISLKSNKLIVLGVFISILLQIIVMETPLLARMLQIDSISVFSLVILFVIASSILLLVEFYKKIRYVKK